MTFSKKALLAATTLAVSFVSADMAIAQDATLSVGGRFQADYTIADINDPDLDISANEIRRARIFVKGNYGDSISYKLELNKSSGDAIEATDAFIQFAPKGSKFKVKVGQFKTQNSLDEQTSSRFISTLERAAFTDAFEFNRRLGIGVSTSGSNYGVDVGVFSSNLENEEFPESSVAFAGRGFYNPVKSDDLLVHLGASFRHRNQGEDQSDLRYRQRPFTHVTGDRIINTTRFADSDTFYGIEGAVIKDNLWVAGEYALLNANGSDTNEDADFSGFYAEAGLFFGGTKTYKGGKFNRPKVDNPVGSGGYGAVSVVARYDNVDLEDGIHLGQLETFVLGADWWPTKQTRIGINYFNADAENGNADSGNGFVGRVQFDF